MKAATAIVAAMTMMPIVVAAMVVEVMAVTMNEETMKDVESMVKGGAC